jgi:hypothetical protein
MAVNRLNKDKIPSAGATASRPSSAAIGDTHYNGTLGRLEIYTSQGWMALSAPPQTPTGVTATDAGSGRAYNNGSASVAFTPATAGGLPTSYVVTSSPGSYTATGSVSPIIVSGQQSNTSYTYTVVASNDYATASASSASSAVTATTLAEVPTSVTAFAGNNLATVQFTAGQTGGASTTYTATSSPGSFTATGTSPITVSGLTNGTSYTFTVTATNANGSVVSSASNSVTPVLPELTVDYLVVAGGAGGGHEPSSGSRGGGGGAGGLRCTVTATGGGGALESALSRSTATNYTVTIGAGGGKAANGTLPGSNGSNSIFSTITSTGGGGGGRYSSGVGTGVSGGSGGGASASGSINSGGSGTAGQGYAGGGNTVNNSAAGGGGAGGVGGNGSGTLGGPGGGGGPGVATSITGSSVHYAGGGGGGANGGAGGGGIGGGSNGYDGTSGGTNTGGGGGTNANGGSGVVILRYPDAYNITVGAGLTGTQSSASGGYKRATITAGTGNVTWAVA